MAEFRCKCQYCGDFFVAGSKYANICFDCVWPEEDRMPELRCTCEIDPKLIGGFLIKNGKPTCSTCGGVRGAKEDKPVSPGGMRMVQCTRCRKGVLDDRPHDCHPTKEAIIGDLQEEVRALKGKLDIIVREGAGEPPDSLAADYGGTHWEMSDEVQAVRKQRTQSEATAEDQRKVIKDLNAKLTERQEECGRRYHALASVAMTLNCTATEIDTDSAHDLSVIINDKIASLKAQLGQAKAEAEAAKQEVGDLRSEVDRWQCEVEKSKKEAQENWDSLIEEKRARVELQLRAADLEKERGQARAMVTGLTEVIENAEFVLKTLADMGSDGRVMLNEDFEQAHKYAESQRRILAAERGAVPAHVAELLAVVEAAKRLEAWVRHDSTEPRRAADIALDRATEMAKLLQGLYDAVRATKA